MADTVTSRTFGDWASAPSLPVVAYRSFSAKLAPGLSAAAAALFLLGGLGTWLRVVISESAADVPADTNAVLGYQHAHGWVLAIGSVLLLIASWFWTKPGWLLKVIPSSVGIVLIGLATWRIAVIDGEAVRMLAEAHERLDFVNYHVGFGWGAWLLLTAAVVVAVSILIGCLREFDVERDKSEA